MAQGMKNMKNQAFTVHVSNATGQSMVIARYTMTRSAITIQWATIACFVLAGLALPACHHPRNKNCQRFHAVLYEPKTAHAAALVDGVPIPVEEVKHQIGATGKSPRQALDELIDFQVLVAEAKRLGFDQSPDVQRAVASAAAYKLIKIAFERSHSAKDVPNSRLKKAYQLNIHHFVRPELRRFSHVLVRLPWRRLNGQKVIYKDEIKGARHLAQEFHDIVASELRRRKLTWREFEALADHIEDRGFKILVERGTKDRAGLAESFSNALFDIPKAGDISQVVKTRYGFHVIYLQKILRPKNVSFSQARPQVLAHVYPEWRSEAFTKWLQSIATHCSTIEHPERIPVAGACATHRRGQGHGF